MQIKTIMRYHLTLVRMAIIKKSTNKKFWGGCEEKGALIPIPCWWRCKLVQPLWKTLWRSLRKLRTELPYNPTIPLLGIYPDKTIIQTDTCTTMFIAALFKMTSCPSKDEWMKKMWYICTMEYYSATKMCEIMLFAAATWM